jgi:sugar lactone lactonase YvrE
MYENERASHYELATESKRDPRFRPRRKNPSGRHFQVKQPFHDAGEAGKGRAMSYSRSLSQVLIVSMSLIGAVTLAGCAMEGTATEVESGASTAQLGDIQGSNFGGHAPIVGSKIFVLEATTGGYGAAAKSLLSSASRNASYPTVQDTSGGATNGMYYVKTDATGSFNISGDYSCDEGQPVYLYAAGGSPSTVAGTPSNAAIVNLAMLGVCSSLQNFSNINFVYINEVSSVAASYAMAGFATDSLHIGSSSTNLTGLQNAALNAATLYNIQGNGPYSSAPVGEGHIANVVNPANPNGTVPQATIDTLANIVAGCVDSSNTTVGTTPTAIQAESPACSSLFLATTSNGVTGSSTVGGATVPIDTATAMINLAHYPAGVNAYPNGGIADSPNPAALFHLQTSAVPFTPKLADAPKDWTIALTFKSIPTPSAIAIDANGNAYVGTLSTTAGYITELSPQGSVSATSGTSVANLSGMGVSTAGIVWATSNSDNNLYRFSSTLATSSMRTSPQTIKPSALAIDSAGNVYVVNNSATYPYFNISEFNSAGVVTNYATNYQFSVANGVAVAANGAVWVTANNSSFNLFPNPSTPVVGGVSLVGGGFSNVNAVAVDYQASAWITGKTTGNQSLVRTSNLGVQTSYGANTNNNAAIGGLNNPVGVAVDGSNVNNGNNFNVWVANSGNNTISEINSASRTTALSPSVGYQSGTGLLNGPSAIAVDSAGNVWVTNQGNSTVTEILGSATPVATLAASTPGVAP